MACGDLSPENKARLKVARRLMHRFVPVTMWSRHLSRAIVRDDVIGGFIVGVMIVPTCLSWSSLAGLPLSCGLIAAMVASFSYGTFGQCACLSIGPVAEITTLLISIPGIAMEDRKDIFQSLGVQVGLLSMALSFIDCGTVIKTIFAKAVGDGYTCAAALLAIGAQLKVMFNVTPVDKGFGTVINTMIAVFQHGVWNSLQCFFLFMIFCTYLIQIKKTKAPMWIPHQLIVVVVSILVTWGFRLDERLGIAIVKDIPASLSWPHFPPMNNILGLAPYTLTITVLNFVQMYVIAQRVMPGIDPNTELFAGGITNFLVNIMSGMPVSNSFSCSSVLMEQRVHTPLTAYTAGSVVLITVLFLTRLGVFYYLPKIALAAIVVASVWRLVNFEGPQNLWRYSRKDAAVWILTFSLTVLGGITVGVLSGIAFSLVLVVLRIARPRAVSVGFNMATFRYGDIRKDPELLVYPNVLLWRFDAPLYFINTGFFQSRLEQAIEGEVRPIDVIVIICGKIVDMDAAALANLPLLLDSVSKRDDSRPPRKIILTDVHGRLEKVLMDSEALPIYVPDEHDRLSMAQMEASKRFPVVFKKLEDAIAFAQRYIVEQYGNVDTAPYPNVSFLTDVVVETAKMQIADGDGRSLLAVIEGESAELANDSLFGSFRTPSRGGGGGERGEEEEDDGALLRAAPSAILNVTPAAENVTIVSGSGEGTTSVPLEPSPVDARALHREQLLQCLAKLNRMSTFSADRELIGVIGVIRHGEVTPKQKKKLMFSSPELLHLAFGGKDLRKSKRTLTEMQEFFSLVEEKLRLAPYSIHSASVASGLSGMGPSHLHGSGGSPAGTDSALVAGWRRVLSIVQSKPQGLKIQVKPVVRTGAHSPSISAASFGSREVAGGGRGGGGQDRSGSLGGDDSPGSNGEEEIYSGILVVKWGGVLTKSGITQAHVLGEKLFARFYAAGDLPLRRLMQFTRNPSVTASDENRVIKTALVVVNALTQTGGTTIKREQLTLDDALMKRMNPTAKALLHEEYKYYESLLHIKSAAAARHFFHIPGFRKLLWIPPLDRPLEASGDGEEGSDDEDESEDEDHLISSISQKRTGGRGFNRGFHATGLTGGLSVNRSTVQPTDISFAQGSRASHPSDERAFNLLHQSEFYTPYQVLQELQEVLETISETELPSEVAHLPLSNNETVQELQLRYESLLTNFMGGKRRMKAVTLRRSTHKQANRDKRPAEAGEEDEGDDLYASDASSDENEDPLMEELNPGADTEESEGNSRKRADRERPASVGAMQSGHYGPRFSPPSAQRQRPPGRGGPLEDGACVYDVSDVSKLRDYGAYDFDYNLPALREMHSLLEDGRTSFLVRKLADALQRLASITESMSRVGENVLEGVNSSKRFIIGSLVSGLLLERLHRDYKDFAEMDERRGVRELLIRAQGQYLADNGGVEQDVRHFMKLFRCKGSKKRKNVLGVREAGVAPTSWDGETAAEREFRLKFPFIALPKDAREEKTGSTENEHSRPTVRGAGKEKSGVEEQSYTRFYFTSYLHVEGVLQCLFESSTVEGFSHPSKEELEATHQLYMKHLIFKVFRRRNHSFTDADSTAAFRKLRLLFRSDIDYDKQQAELQKGIAAIYHAMYYVSMEIYLSLGDAEGGQGDAADALFPIYEGRLQPQGTTDDLSGSGVFFDGGGEGSVKVPSSPGGRPPRSGSPGLQTSEKTKPLSVPSSPNAIPAAVVVPTTSSKSVKSTAFSVRSPLYQGGGEEGSPASPSLPTITVQPPQAVTGAALAPPRGDPVAMNLVHFSPPSPTLSAGSAPSDFVVPAPATSGPMPAMSPHVDAAEEDAEITVLANTMRISGGSIVLPTGRLTNSSFILAPLSSGVSAGAAKLHRTSSMNALTTASGAAASDGEGVSGQAAAARGEVAPKEGGMVLVTPEAGRGSALKKEMKHRVCTVTPMRRIHEGLSLNDFVLLMREVASAIRSQKEQEK